MEPDCIFSLGLVMGVVAGALMAHGASVWRGARAKIKSFPAAKAKAEGEVTKAEERYRQGRGELPGALFLMALGLALLIFVLILILSNALF